MLRTLAVFAFLASAQAFACPNLTGSYTCTDNGQSQIMTISQANKGTFTDYNVNGQDIVTDNIAHPQPDQDNVKQSTMRAWCNDDATLHLQLLVKYYDNNAPVGDITVNLDISMQAQNLHQVTTGGLAANGQTYPVNSDIVCTKNP